MAHWLCEGDVGLPSAAGVVPSKRWNLVPECAKQNLQKCCQLPSKFTLVVNMPSLALVWGATLTKAAAGICFLCFFLLHFFLAWLAILFLHSNLSIFVSFLHSCTHSSVHPCLSLAATVRGGNCSLVFCERAVPLVPVGVSVQALTATAGLYIWGQGAAALEEPSYTSKRRGNAGCTGELCCGSKVGVSVLCSSLDHWISSSMRLANAGHRYLVCVSKSVAVNGNFPLRSIQTNNSRYQAQISIRQLHRSLAGCFMAPSMHTNGDSRSVLASLLT